jgi:hypothetical protein
MAKAAQILLDPTVVHLLAEEMDGDRTLGEPVTEELPEEVLAAWLRVDWPLYC